MTRSHKRLKRTGWRVASVEWTHPKVKGTHDQKAALRLQTVFEQVDRAAKAKRLAAAK